jgi:hypothetical protein
MRQAGSLTLAIGLRINLYEYRCQSSIARSQEYLFDDGSELEANFELN